MWESCRASRTSSCNLEPVWPLPRSTWLGPRVLYTRTLGCVIFTSWPFWSDFKSEAATRFKVVSLRREALLANRQSPRRRSPTHDSFNILPLSMMESRSAQQTTEFALLDTLLFSKSDQWCILFLFCMMYIIPVMLDAHYSCLAWYILFLFGMMYIIPVMHDVHYSCITWCILFLFCWMYLIPDCHVAHYSVVC